MHNTITIRNRTFGEGKPWIIVPIVGGRREDILSKAKEISVLALDMVEWRADFYEDVFDASAVTDTLSALNEALGEIPLLFTFRTKSEGGEKAILPGDYTRLNLAVAKSNLADAVDVEIMAGDALVSHLIAGIRDEGARVVASNHDFYATPGKDEIIRRLVKMQDMGADVLKIACMPQSAADVLTLMSAVNEMTATLAKKPVVAMSMAAQGVLSRVAGEVFGSAMTFGAVGATSAPGQIPVDELRSALDIIHKSMKA